VIYTWFKNPGYSLPEYLIGPIPDYIQIIASFFYIVKMATDLVNWVKYFQASVLPYMYVRSYMLGARHDMFSASFAFMKAFFNTLDASIYFNTRFGVIGKIIEGF